MVQFSFGYLIGNSASSCGYCGSAGDTSSSFGIWTYTLSCQHYQRLLDLGWRRSGKYLYKPNVDVTCCPPYTIRLDSNKFEPSKGQMKVLKKVQKYLLNGGNVAMEVRKLDSKTAKDVNTDLIETHVSVPAVALNTHMEVDQEPLPRPNPKPILQRSSGLSRLFGIIENHQPEHKHKLSTKMEPASFCSKTFELYKKYQIAIHNDTEDELTEQKFTNFLVESPLQKDPTNPQYGSFHQKYYIDDQLIAVGVLDILPNCVSSVYFIYDPDFGKLSLGTFSALKELCTTMELSQSYPALKYYYLGYYIHSCPKMRYKAQYQPSELLCPYTFTWVKVSDVVQLLEKEKSTLLVDPKTRKLLEAPIRYSDYPARPISYDDIFKALVVVENRLCSAKVFSSIPSFIEKLKYLLEKSTLDVINSLVFVPPNESESD